MGLVTVLRAMSILEVLLIVELILLMGRVRVER